VIAAVLLSTLLAGDVAAPPIGVGGWWAGVSVAAGWLLGVN
jgi:hypothetical protein